MPTLTLISWRDIPAQILVGSGRGAIKRELSARFAEAIDMAAMKAGAKDSEAYLADWRRAPIGEVEGDPVAAAEAHVARIEDAFPRDRLLALVANGGHAEAPVVEHRIVFTPSGKRGSFPSGTDLLTAARALGVDLDSVCGGRGICGRCRVEVSTGDFAKHAIVSTMENVSAVGDVEARYTRIRGEFPSNHRLGCQAKILGDVVIDVPAESQLHRQVVRKSPDERPVAVDPVVTLHYVVVTEPDMHDPSSDARRLLAALEAQWGLANLEIPLPVLAGLQKTLRDAKWAVTVAVRERRTVVSVHVGLIDRVLGMAVDVGSTTIAAHLCDLTTGAVLASAGVMNPQIRYGEDLMSRVSYVMMNPGGERELTGAVRRALDDLVGTLVAQARATRGDVVEMVVVGNPVMHHLLLGLDPTELGGAPFALAVDGPLDVPARDLGLDIAPGGYVHALPCIAGHVGADAAAVVLAEAPHLADEPTLIVDVGTNAEIVLGDRTRLLACSSPTGPAFEGAQITAGQRAAPGAIERVRIDPETLEPRFKVIGCDLWSDEPGFAEATKATGVTGICGSGIIEVIAEMVIAGIVTTDGRIDGALAARTQRVREEYRTYTYLIAEGTPRIAVTQHDVRAIQLAKAALYAGAKLLMARAGLDAVAAVKFAGAFGSHISAKHAMALGLVPDCPLDRVTAVGNAAGHGARIALVNAAARREIADLVRHIEKIETAVEPNFQAEFVGAMGLPHASEPFTHLRAVVAMPPPRAAEPQRRRRERT